MKYLCAFCVLAFLAACGGSGSSFDLPEIEGLSLEELERRSAALLDPLDTVEPDDVDLVLPQTGRASYTGVAALQDPSQPGGGFDALGEMVVAVDFADRDVTGEAGNFYLGMGEGRQPERLRGRLVLDAAIDRRSPVFAGTVSAELALNDPVQIDVDIEGGFLNDQTTIVGSGTGIAMTENGPLTAEFAFVAE